MPDRPPEPVAGARRALAILGSTGSIGRSTLELLDRHPGWYELAALTAGTDVDRLAEQVRRYRPRLAVVAEGRLEQRLRDLCSGTGCRVAGGPAALALAAVESEADLVLAAIVGGAGLLPTFQALEAGIPVALANKEALVMAGPLMVEMARRTGAALLPVDSEHNALHQCMRGESAAEVRRLILTASGGPFRESTGAEMERATPAQALRHPTWVMGRKITIDSATLMNKGLEVIEARWLFGLPPERIDVLIHPQSVVHSMVEFRDGAIIAQLGVNDMKHPIQYALTYPHRLETSLEPLDLVARSPLNFMAVDRQKFRCLDLAYRALAAGGMGPVALNAANEVAVEAFLRQDLSFPGIADLVEGVLATEGHRPAGSLEAVLEGDAAARRQAARLLERRAVR